MPKARVGEENRAVFQHAQVVSVVELFAVVGVGENLHLEPLFVDPRYPPVPLLAEYEVFVPVERDGVGAEVYRLVHLPLCARVSGGAHEDGKTVLFRPAVYRIFWLVREKHFAGGRAVKRALAEAYVALQNLCQIPLGSENFHVFGRGRENFVRGSAAYGCRRAQR